MIDRIEELLAELAAEDDEEQQQDALALTMTEGAVPASPRGDGGEAGDGGTGDGSSGGQTTEEIVPEWPGQTAGMTEESRTGDRSGGQTAGEIAPERPGLAAGGMEAAVESSRAAGEPWKDGSVWTVRGVEPEMDGPRRAAAAQRTDQAEDALRQVQDGGLAWIGLGQAARGSVTGLALERVRRSEAAQAGLAQAGLEQAGLKGLYRQTVQGLRPAAPTLPPEQAGRTARAQEPGSAASLAVDELDRAMRRDSRRYDGGMSIY